MDEADEIWNRAADDPDGVAEGARPGDRALAHLLLLHGHVMNGGLLDAVMNLTDAQLGSAIDGYRWMGLDRAAGVVVEVRDEVASGPVSQEDPEEVRLQRAGALEAKADTLYFAAVPDDATVEVAFRAKLAQQPEAFAGSQPGVSGQ